MRFYNVQNKLTDVSTEFAVFICRVHAELIGGKNVNNIEELQGLHTMKGKVQFNPQQATKARNGSRLIGVLFL
jgi:hypothetical protein